MATRVSFTTESVQRATETTSAVSAITMATASGGGNVTNDGRDGIGPGIRWSEDQNPDLSDAHSTDGSGTGSFTSSIDGLDCGTTYWCKGLCDQRGGDGLWQPGELIRLPVPCPRLQIHGSEQCHFEHGNQRRNVTNDGGSDVMVRGVCWSTGRSPTTPIRGRKTGAGTGSYSSSVTGLEPGTTYYLRAYAKNAQGTDTGISSLSPPRPMCPPW
ncbi:MAG: hypothetical protein R2751_09980 [Bacteroidales bacterium]